MNYDDIPFGVIRATPPPIERTKPSTTSKDTPHHLRKRLSYSADSQPPMFNLGANEYCAMISLAKASRSIGQVAQGIKVIEDAFRIRLSEQQITQAMRKADITPLTNPKGSWTASDTAKLLQ